jgi:prophage regulatory protein
MPRRPGIISRKELRILVPYSDMHISRPEKAGRFPPRIQVGDARVGWSFREVQEWIAAKKAARHITNLLHHRLKWSWRSAKDCLGMGRQPVTCSPEDPSVDMRVRQQETDDEEEPVQRRADHRRAA